MQDDQFFGSVLIHIAHGKSISGQILIHIPAAQSAPIGQTVRFQKLLQSGHICRSCSRMFLGQRGKRQLDGVRNRRCSRSGQSIRLLRDLRSILLLSAGAQKPHQAYCCAGSQRLAHTHHVQLPQ